MLNAQFCFLSNRYYEDFEDDHLMKNKDLAPGGFDSQICCFAFQDDKTPEIYWLVPVTSRYKKFRKLEEKKIAKYGKCNTIRFGTLLGRCTAFLIQNMTPATEEYLIPYLDKDDHPIQIEECLAEDIIRNAHEVLAISRRGKKVVFPDIFAIYARLKQQLQEAHLANDGSDQSSPNLIIL